MPHTISRLADFLPHLLAITATTVCNRIVEEHVMRFGIKLPEWRVMAVLGDAGALTQRQLVGATMMDKVAVNRACKLLEDRGLAGRSPNAQDGRSHHLELTERGRVMHGQIMELALAMEEQLFGVLSEAEREQFKDMLERLRNRAHKDAATS